MSTAAPSPASSGRPSLWARLDNARWAHSLVRLALAGLFLWTGVEKLLAPEAFATAIAGYRALPSELVGLAAVGLPVLEVVAGVALLLPRYAQGGAVLCAFMLILFAGGMAQSRLRGIDVDCGCFGAAVESQVSWLKVTLNVALAMLALWTSRLRMSLGFS